MGFLPERKWKMENNASKNTEIRELRRLFLVAFTGKKMAKRGGVLKKQIISKTAIENFAYTHVSLFHRFSIALVSFLL